MVRSLAAFLSLAGLMAACTSGSALLDESTAAVLVPDDDRFLSQWIFRVEPSANNYKALTHWDPSFNDEIDRTLTVESYQINRAADWVDNPPGDDAGTRAALTQVLTDSANATQPCEASVDGPPVLRCEYQDANGEPLVILARRLAFDGNETIMLSLGDSAASNDYISGTFTPTRPTDANSWFDG